MNEYPAQTIPNPLISEIKKTFFLHRNGIVADALRKNGISHKFIMGLQLPEIGEIAKKYPEDKKLAKDLWQDKESRESRLLAIYLFPKQDITLDETLELIADVKSREEAEILAFRFLKYLSFAKDLIDNNLWNRTSLSEEAFHCILMLKKNLQAMGLIDGESL